MTQMPEGTPCMDVSRETKSSPIGLFEAFGVELEYMLVDQATLDVAPVADRLLRDEQDNPCEEIERGPLSWSNELTLHVIELKTSGPAKSLAPLANQFQGEVAAINEKLQSLDARLMPSGMHPWMQPNAETKLWPHGYNEVYNLFNQIFDCRGHGWANLQSVHLNLPFANDEEFGRLHAAIRLLLPILPAICASSPVAEGALTSQLDFRLETYRHNADRIPSVSGQIVPEAVFTREQYESRILERIYQDLQPYDARGTLRHEWVNARGAIARFDRNTIEIRVMDVQECPVMDVAICDLVARVAQNLTLETWSSVDSQKAADTTDLQLQLIHTIHGGDQAIISDTDYLKQFGWSKGPCTAGELWRHLGQQLPGEDASLAAAMEIILQQGPLARRILAAISGDPDKNLRPTYAALCDCLAEGRPFSRDSLV